jgi:hypothetical protein
LQVIHCAQDFKCEIGNAHAKSAFFTEIDAFFQGYSATAADLPKGAGHVLSARMWPVGRALIELVNQTGRNCSLEKVDCIAYFATRSQTPSWPRITNAPTGRI